MKRDLKPRLSLTAVGSLLLSACVVYEPTMPPSPMDAGVDGGLSSTPDAAHDAGEPGRDAGSPNADAGAPIPDAGEPLAAPWSRNEDWTWHMDVAAVTTAGRNDMDGVSVDPFGFVVTGGPFTAGPDASGECGVSFDGIPRCSGVGSDIYVARLRPDGTEAMFVVIDSGQGDDFMFDLTTDANGDIYLSGQYSGQLTSANGNSVEAARDGSAYVAKLARDTGDIVWIEAFGGTEAAGGFGAGANEIAIDSLGDVIATITTDNRPASYRVGEWTIDNPDFDAPTNPLRTPGKDSFIVKLNPTDGRPLWYFATENNGEPGEHRVRAIGVNGQNQIAFGYQVRGTIRLGDTTYTPDGRGRSSYGAAGLLSPTGQLLWSLDVAAAATPDAEETNVRGAGGSIDGDIYLTGRLGEGDPNQATVRVRGSNHGTDAQFVLQTFAKGTTYLLKLSAQGTVQWIRLLGNNDTDAGGELTVSDREDIYITGRNRGPAYAAYRYDLSTEQRSLLTPEVHGAPSTNTRATVTRFDSAGNVTGAYAPSTVGFSAGGVLEAEPGSACLAMQFGFQGEVTLNNPLLTPLSSTAAADEALTRVCFAPVERRIDLPASATSDGNLVIDGVNYGPTYYYLGGERGTVVCLHGAGGSAASWATPSGTRQDFLRDLADAGYSFVCPSSRDRGGPVRPAQWSADNTALNPDVVQVDQLLSALGRAPAVGETGRLFVVGHSNGGGFGSRWAALSMYSTSVRAIQYSSAAGVTAIVTNPGYRTPSLYTYSRLDSIGRPDRIETHLANLAERDVDHVAVDVTPYHQWQNEDPTPTDYHAFWNSAAVTVRFFGQYARP